MGLGYGHLPVNYVSVYSGVFTIMKAKLPFKVPEWVLLERSWLLKEPTIVQKEETMVLIEPALVLIETKLLLKESAL
jgi:hypothetical protein